MLKFLGLILFLLPVSLRAQESAEKCISRSDHTALSILMIDLSDPISDIDSFKSSISVFQGQIRPGERVIVGISTDKVGDVKLVMDYVNPEPSVWVSKLKTQALQKTFKECLRSSIEGVTKYNQKYANSAILETLSFVSRIIKADSSSSQRLYIYSDMMQNSPSVSFYKQ